MPMEWKHRGRIITADDIIFIQQLIDANPRASRRQLSAKLCEAWQWKQANGALRDMVCRGLLLMLDRGGQIQLPPIKKRPNNPLARRQKPAPLLIDTTPIRDPLRQLQPIHIQQVRRTGDEALYNGLIEQHHYLGYEQPVGEHLKYIVWATGRPIRSGSVAPVTTQRTGSCWVKRRGVAKTIRRSVRIDRSNRCWAIR